MKHIFLLLRGGDLVLFTNQYPSKDYNNEEIAQTFAEKFPEIIYFFAEIGPIA